MCSYNPAEISQHGGEGDSTAGGRGRRDGKVHWGQGV